MRERIPMRDSLTSAVKGLAFACQAGAKTMRYNGRGLREAGLVSQPLAIGTELNSQYRILRLVGGGGMAWVYQVEELPSGSGILWALKELRPQTQNQAERESARKLFEQEARLLRDLDHVNIPKIADFFEDAGRACLVMEFIWGESLEKRLEAANAPLLETDVLQWAIQLCDALDYLHTRQPPIIFRDMKPSNVMVTNTGLIKLIDFGIARTYKVGKKRDTVAMGSENYAAPEQWGKGQTDARSDVYGLGATVYHLLANMAPTPAFLPSEPLPLSNYTNALSPETTAAVEKAMAREPTDRFQSAQEMRKTLVRALPGPIVSPTVLTAARSGPDPDETVPRPLSEQDPDATVPRHRLRVHGTEAKETPGPDSQATAPGEVPEVKTEPGRMPPASPPAKTGTGHRPKKPAAPATVDCPACGRANRSTARFCVRCGHAFGPLGQAVLRVVEPVRAAWEMPVARNPTLLGRASEAEEYRPEFDMTFYDEGNFVSRRHARITKGRGGYFVADLGSYNGTVVNGQLIAPGRARLLRNGDRIKVGLVVIEFRLR
jgi:serine/threonine-protein kinase